MNTRRGWLRFIPVVLVPLKATGQALRMFGASRIPYVTQNSDGNSFLGKGPAVNNQCPVCGTMAAPFPLGGIDRTNNGHPLSLIHSLAMASDHLARCLHCNNAFWQEAEPTK